MNPIGFEAVKLVQFKAALSLATHWLRIGHTAAAPHSKTQANSYVGLSAVPALPLSHSPTFPLSIALSGRESPRIASAAVCASVNGRDPLEKLARKVMKS